MIFFSGRAGAEEKAFPLTNIHRALAAKDAGWLNTSRALAPEDLQGRIILLDFWTFCCINCMQIVPDLQYLEEKFGDKLTVIGVHSAKFANERDTSNIRSAILRYGIHHPVVNDFDFSIWQRFGVKAWPTLMLISPEGILEEVYSGEGHRAELEEQITALIKKYDKRLVTTPLPVELESAKAPPSFLSFPGKLEVVQNNDTTEEPILYISDSANHRVVTTSESGEVGLIVGSGKEGFKDGGFAEAEFRRPQGVLYDGKRDRLYVADTGNHALRAIDFKAKQVTTLAGTGERGPAFSANDKFIPPAPKEMPLASPWDLAFFPDQNHLVIAMAGTHQLWTYDIEHDAFQLLAGNGREAIDDGALPRNSLSQPSDLAVVGNKLYFMDSESSSLRVFENGKITTLMGTGLFDFGFADGKRGKGLLQHPIGLYADEKDILIADSYNHAIRRYDAETGELFTVAGNGKPGFADGAYKDASFNEPNDIVKVGERFFVADTNNNAIRILDPKTKTVSTFNIKEPSQSALPSKPSETLPNLADIGDLKLLAGSKIALILKLKKGWHINPDAPSSITLFKGDDASGYTPATSLSLAELTKKTTPMLPALDSGLPYRLQGTLYYCEDKAGSVCLIKSFDERIVPEKKKGAKKISIELDGTLP